MPKKKLTSLKLEVAQRIATITFCAGYDLKAYAEGDRTMEDKARSRGSRKP